MYTTSKLPNQRDYEKLAFLLRRHWFIFLKIFLLYLILFLIPVGFYYALPILYPELELGNLGRAILILGASLYYLLTWTFFYGKFIDYYLDVWIVTNDRIRNIEQKGLFNRTISELKLYRIQDATSEVKGFLPTFLDFGNVYIQTAGEKERFIFRDIPQPEEICRKIMELAESDRRFHALDIQATV